MASPASCGDIANPRLLMMGDAAAGERQAGEEAALVRQSKAGDLAAFEQLISLHERQVYQTTLRLLHRSADAPDACQEVFLRFYKHLHRLDERRPCSPWLYRITVNVCHGINRQRRKQPWLSLDDPGAGGALIQNAHSAPDPLRQVSGAEQERLLGEALKRLPEKERAALVLRDLEGLSTREVAKILGSSETTVRSQISRARVKLKDLCDDFRRNSP